MEINPVVAQKLNYFTTHEARRHESRRIADLGPLWASTRASINYLQGCPIEDCLKSKTDFVKCYNKLSRKERIATIEETNKLCKKISSYINPNCTETNLAHQARSLTVLSKIITAGLTEDYEAVMVTDLLMGSAQIQIGQIGLTIDWKNKEIKID
jgi:hypothetical protein